MTEVRFDSNVVYSNPGILVPLREEKDINLNLYDRKAFQLPSVNFFIDATDHLK